MPAPEPGEVLIEVSACGMNNTDVWVREGAYTTSANPDAIASWRGRAAGDTLTFPRIQGADTVGRIVAVGEGVRTGRIGERIVVDFSMYNRDDDSLADIDHVGHGRDGGYAEYCVVPADNAHPVHRDLVDAELATFCCAGRRLPCEPRAGSAPDGTVARSPAMWVRSRGVAAATPSTRADAGAA